MRLGVAAMTVIDALAVAFATKERSASGGEGLQHLLGPGHGGRDAVPEGASRGLDEMQVKVGNPMRAMLAERLPSPEEILERMGGAGRSSTSTTASGSRPTSTGRADHALLPTTGGPDRPVPRCGQGPEGRVQGQSAIVEGECVPVDLNTGELLPFQEVSHRRGRKHGLEEAIEDYPVRIFLFDCLFLDGKDMTDSPYPGPPDGPDPVRQRTENARFSEAQVLDDVDGVQEFFRRP